MAKRARAKEDNEEDLIEGYDDEDDELCSSDERGIEEYLGEKDEKVESLIDSESELAFLAAQFLDRSKASVTNKTLRDDDEEARRRKEKKLARRKRQRERQKEAKKESRLETTAYVRSFGDDTFSKDELTTIFPEARIRLCGDSVNGRSRQAFVEVDDPKAMAKVLSLHRTKLGAIKLSVRAALTKSGLESLVTDRQKKKRKKSNPSSEPIQSSKKKDSTKKKQKTDSSSPAKNIKAVAATLKAKKKGTPR